MRPDERLESRARKLELRSPAAPHSHCLLPVTKLQRRLVNLKTGILLGARLKIEFWQSSSSSSSFSSSVSWGAIRGRGRDRERGGFGEPRLGTPGIARQIWENLLSSSRAMLGLPVLHRCKHFGIPQFSSGFTRFRVGIA